MKDSEKSFSAADPLPNPKKAIQKSYEPFRNHLPSNHRGRGILVGGRWDAQWVAS